MENQLIASQQPVTAPARLPQPLIITYKAATKDFVEIP
jgi:hypothetical protein